MIVKIIIKFLLVLVLGYFAWSFITCEVVNTPMGMTVEEYSKQLLASQQENVYILRPDADREIALQWVRLSGFSALFFALLFLSSGILNLKKMILNT